MADLRPAFETLEKLAAQAADGLKHFGRVYLAVLFNPGRDVSTTAAGSSWPFPLALIFGHSVVSAVLLGVAWPVAARGIGLGNVVETHRLNVALVCLATMVFLFSLSAAALVGVRVFARQRAGLLIAMNCVAAAVVPFSALTVAAWVVLYFSPALSLLVLMFGVLAALYFFAEALRSQCDMTVGCSLYVVPLMIIVALLATALFLIAASGRI